VFIIAIDALETLDHFLESIIRDMGDERHRGRAGRVQEPPRLTQPDKLRGIRSSGIHHSAGRKRKADQVGVRLFGDTDDAGKCCNPLRSRDERPLAPWLVVPRPGGAWCKCTTGKGGPISG
jgi:hypothetical protein